MDWKCKLVLLTYFVSYLVEDPAPDIKIEQGVVRGKVSENGRFYKYLGIPYATTNQESRFQAPLPPPTWKGVYKAVDEHYGCPQRIGVSSIMVTGDEDCLKINVHVPANVEKPLPVMVYIHGGGFVMGSGGKSIYASDFLVKHDVILVTFNYRLGPLGFICLGIREAPGNAGLKDQIAALRWVKKNIAAFGGDPDNVTLFGESAGATSTSILITSDSAKGLFHKAIVQSGSSISSWAINRTPIWTASLLAKLLGNDTKDPQELYQVLKNAPYSDLTRKRIYKPWEKHFETALAHLPCVEKSFEGIEPVIKDLPYNILKSGKFNKVPVMMGFNDKEGLFMISREDEESLIERNKGYLFASDLEFPSEEEAEYVAKGIKEFYFGNMLISIGTILNISNVYTDTYFAVPETLETELLCETDCTVYNYLFKYAGMRNVVKFVNGYFGTDGAAHGDELLYLFKGRVWPLWINTKDQLMIDRLTTMWTNFAKFGDPTPKITNALPLRWERSMKNNLKFLYIDEDLKMGPIPNKEAFDLWKNIYSRYRRKIGNIED